MKKEPVIGQLLHPLNDCVLVELKQSSKNFNIKEGKYDTRTEGIIICLPKWLEMADDKTLEPDNLILKNLVNKRIHFEEFKEGARIKRNEKIYSFIKIEDIRGWEEESKDGS